MAVLTSKQIKAEMDLIDGSVRPLIDRCFDPSSETVPFLAKKKAKASSKLALHKVSGVEPLADACVWLTIWGRSAEVIACARAVQAVPFTGNFTLWGPIEDVIALGAWMASRSGEEETSKQLGAAVACVYSEANERTSWFPGPAPTRNRDHQLDWSIRNRDASPDNALRYGLHAIRAAAQLRAEGATAKWCAERLDQFIVEQVDETRRLKKITAPALPG